MGFEGDFFFQIEKNKRAINLKNKQCVRVEHKIVKGPACERNISHGGGDY